MNIPGMIIFLIIFFCIFFSNLKVLILNIKNRNALGILITLLSLPFAIFVLSAFLLGGTPFNNASSEYELYQAGRYYLESHNVYTEVTRAQYVYMQIIQIVGIGTFFIECILCIIFKDKFKKNDDSLELNLKTGSNNIED